MYVGICATEMILECFKRLSFNNPELMSLSLTKPLAFQPLRQVFRCSKIIWQLGGLCNY